MPGGKKVPGLSQPQMNTYEDIKKGYLKKNTPLKQAKKIAAMTANKLKKSGKI